MFIYKSVECDSGAMVINLKAPKSSLHLNYYHRMLQKNDALVLPQGKQFILQKLDNYKLSHFFSHKQLTHRVKGHTK